MSKQRKHISKLTLNKNRRTNRPFLVFTVSLPILFALLVFSGCDILGVNEIEDDIDDENGDTLPAEGEYDPGGDVDGDGILNTNDTDIDGDGLSNDIETNTHHTSPYIADTDGDGWNDDEELLNYVETYPPKFSPLVADLPGMKLTLRSETAIELKYFNTTGTEVSYQVGETTSMSSGYTHSNTLTQSMAAEYGWSYESGIEVGTSGGDPHVVSHVNVGAHGTYTQETGHSWSNSRTVEHDRAVSRIRNRTTSEARQSRGGTISVAVSFANVSNIAYDVNDVTLACYKLIPDEDFVKPIATLECGSGLSFSLDPQGGSGQGDDTVYVFEDNSLTVEKTLELMEDSCGVVFGIAGYDVSMEGRNFNEANTEVPVRTAEVIIDYGPGLQDKPVERYSVATKTDFNPDATSSGDQFNPIPLQTVLERIGVSVVTGTTGDYHGIQSVNSVAQDTSNRKYWYLVHRFEQDGQEWSTYYTIRECSCDLSDIMIGTGDTVELIFSEDVDDDGVPLRTETMFGSDDEKIDSDGDGVDDNVELEPDPGPPEAPYTSLPGTADTDGDGLNDSEDPEPRTPRTTDSTALEDIVLSDGIDTDAYELSFRDHLSLGADQSLPTDLSGSSFPIPNDAMYITVTPEVNVKGLTLQSDSVPEEEYELTPGLRSLKIPLEPQNNGVSLKVTATDGSTEHTYDFSVDAYVPQPVDFTAAPGELHTEIGLGWSYPPEEQMYNGLLIIRNTVNDFSDLPETIDVLPNGGTFQGYDLVYGPEQPLDRSITQCTDEGLEAETNYYYAAVLYNKEEGDATHYLSEPITAHAATAAAPSVDFSIAPYGMLTVSENDGGVSEFTWTIEAELLDPSNNTVAGTGRELSRIPGPSADPNNPYKVRPDAKIEDARHAYQVEMNTGGFTLFDDVGYPAIWVDEIDSFAGNPKSTLEAAANDSVTDPDFEPGGKSYTINSPRSEDYKVRITLLIQEHDAGGASDVAAGEMFTFAFRENGDQADTWELTTDQNLSNQGSTATHIYASSTTMDEGVEYIFNPYFSGNDEGEVQVFFQLRWQPEL